MSKVNVDINGKPHKYEITIGSDILGDCGRWAKDCVTGDARRAVVISNETVFGLYGTGVKASLESSGFEVFVWLLGDGEEHKNLSSLENALGFFSEKGLVRTDTVIALGGGVVGDLAGFAAAVYLRGISFLQIPTSLLAMIDSSVGGKTAVNTAFGKNLVGSFYQPAGVLVDVSVLKSLEKRELTAGFCEAVKHGAISGEELFNKTGEFLENYPTKNFENHYLNSDFVRQLEDFLASHIAFKARIVMQDEREHTSRSDAKSRKILNFGHTLAHALEKVTDYKYFRHGEAVGYGILFAGELSKRLDILDVNRLNLLNDVVSRAGVLPKTDDIKVEEVYEAFAFDKKVIGKTLQLVLLEDIGKPVIVGDHEIPVHAIEQSLKTVLKKKPG